MTSGATRGFSQGGKHSQRKLTGYLPGAHLSTLRQKMINESIFEFGFPS